VCARDRRNRSHVISPVSSTILYFRLEKKGVLEEKNVGTVLDDSMASSSSANDSSGSDDSGDDSKNGSVDDSSVI